ncbi:MAG TPA: putative Fe-S cluster assembly protein SufT [Candidatus Binatia bacterium]|nr:putative Fe-S cluster assembly protein SufT [Candidatus Binatia bacterium]
MHSDKAIVLKRDCMAVMIPSGEKIPLRAGSSVWITQSLGGSYTVTTDRGYLVRIDGDDADAIGMARLGKPHRMAFSESTSPQEIERQVWDELKQCFDPEIPVNIVDLGLIYDCSVAPAAGGGYKVSVRFTLTAQGCGMGQFLKEDIRKRLLALAVIREADVQLVWDPPWSQNMMSAAAKQQLGMS